MEEEIRKLRTAVRFLTKVVAMNEARENRDRLGADYFPSKFETDVRSLVEEIEDILDK